MFVLMDPTHVPHKEREGTEANCKRMKVSEDKEISLFHNGVKHTASFTENSLLECRNKETLSKSCIVPLSNTNMESLQSVWNTSVPRPVEIQTGQSVQAAPVQEEMVENVHTSSAPHMNTEHRKYPGDFQVFETNRHKLEDVYMGMASSTKDVDTVTRALINANECCVEKSLCEFRTRENEVSVEPFHKQCIMDSEVMNMDYRTPNKPKDIADIDVPWENPISNCDLSIENPNQIEVMNRVKELRDSTPGLNVNDSSKEIITKEVSICLDSKKEKNHEGNDVPYLSPERYGVNDCAKDEQKCEKQSVTLNREWNKASMDAREINGEEREVQLQQLEDCEVVKDDSGMNSIDYMKEVRPEQLHAVKTGAIHLERNLNLEKVKEEKERVFLGTSDLGDEHTGEDLSVVPLEGTKQEALESDGEEASSVLDDEGCRETKVPVSQMKETKGTIQYSTGSVKKGQPMMPGTWRKSKRRKNFNKEKRVHSRRKECMVPGCFLRACTSRFVDFPQEPERRQEWAEMTKLNEKFPNVNPLEPLPIRVGLCMAHFREDDFHVTPRGGGKLCTLKEDIDPSIFPWMKDTANIRNGLDIFKGNKCSREAKLLSVMKSELDNMLNPPSQSEFIIHTYQSRRKPAGIVPPLKISLKACEESAKKKKKKAAKAKRKHNRDRKRDKGLLAIPSEEPLCDVKIENFESFNEDVVEREPNLEDHGMSSPTEQGGQLFGGLNHFLAPCFSGLPVTEQPSPDILGSMNVHLITSCVQAAISPMIARLEAFQERVESRMEQLEGRVSSRLEFLEEKVSVCLEKLSHIGPKQRPNCESEKLEGDTKIPSGSEKPSGVIEIRCGLTNYEEGMVEEPSADQLTLGNEPTASGSEFIESSLHQMTVDIQPFAISEREYEMMEGEDLQVQTKEL